LKLFRAGKDGGPDSTVWGFWFIEWKRLFSVAILCFEKGSREAYHNHAFNSVSWLLKGELIEYDKQGVRMVYLPDIVPIITPRSLMHKVVSRGRSWVLTFRGPWSKTWNEYLPATGQTIALTEGRKTICMKHEAGEPNLRCTCLH
jgi:hypothetical protein